MDANPVALWRYQLIAPLLAVNGPRGTLARLIRNIASQPHAHPIRGPLHLHTRTLEDWLARYRRDGFDGLMPVPRKDQGKSRCIDDALATHIEHLATSHPTLDGPGLLAELRTLNLPGLPSLSSLYRFLRARGLDKRAAPPRADHRAFEFDLPGDCWQGDVMYGPTIAQSDGSRRKTYLIAVLDDHSRLICHAQFYYEQHLTSLKDCLKQAFLKRGLPRRLYFDNGRIFRSRALLALAARLGLQLLHTRPYKPQGRAKLERWFGSVRSGFLARLDQKALTDLGYLNRLLFAWVEGHYHVSPHRSLDGLSPLDRWMRACEALRPLPRDLDLDQLFLEDARRLVAKDGTLSLKGIRFEAGPFFIGRRIEVRFNSFDLRRIWRLDDAGSLHELFPVDLAGNRRVKRTTPPPPPPATPAPPLQAMDQLLAQLEARQHPKSDTQESHP